VSERARQGRDVSGDSFFADEWVSCSAMPETASFVVGCLYRGDYKKSQRSQRLYPIDSGKDELRYKGARLTRAQGVVGACSAMPETASFVVGCLYRGDYKCKTHTCLARKLTLTPCEPSRIESDEGPRNEREKEGTDLVGLSLLVPLVPVAVFPRGGEEETTVL
jgi:hypothetical protein